MADTDAHDSWPGPASWELITRSLKEEEEEELEISSMELALLAIIDISDIHDEEEILDLANYNPWTETAIERMIGRLKDFGLLDEENKTTERGREVVEMASERFDEANEVVSGDRFLSGLSKSYVNTVDKYFNQNN